MPDQKKDEKGEHGNLVEVTIDSRKVSIQSKEWHIAELKKELGVDPAKELEQVIDGKLTPLADDAKVHIRGGEVFVSHVKSGSSSNDI
jgi:ethanolamine utilization protein EutQ (cupin superfamily)